MAGESRNVGCFWGKVTSVDGNSGYIVENAQGTTASFPRQTLRHRVFYTKSFVGVTGDRKHDSYAMRHFVDKELQSLLDSGVIAREMIPHIATHSDNAAQHFKSTKSLSWYSSLLDKYQVIRRFTWDFGAPGHGKGVWDGLFGVLKRWHSAAFFQ